MYAVTNAERVGGIAAANAGRTGNAARVNCAVEVGRDRVSRDASMPAVVTVARPEGTEGLSEARGEEDNPAACDCEPAVSIDK